MLSTQNLSFQYQTGKSFDFPDLNCSKGENLLILGNSGSGKTTLLHLLSGILSPDKGSVFFANKPISELTPKEVDQFRGKNIGMIFQKHFFIQGLSVLDNLIAAQKFSGSGTDKKYLFELMLNLGIHDLAAKRPDALSQGEQQRFSIARALANKPSWVLADEPTSSLDDENCTRFLELFNMVQTQRPVSWVIATHDNRLKNHFLNIYKL